MDDKASTPLISHGNAAILRFINSDKEIIIRIIKIENKAISESQRENVKIFPLFALSCL